MSNDKEKLIQEFKQYIKTINVDVAVLIAEEDGYYTKYMKSKSFLNRIQKAIKMQPYPECEATEHDFESKGCICLDKWLEELRSESEDV